MMCDETYGKGYNMSSDLSLTPNTHTMQRLESLKRATGSIHPVGTAAAWVKPQLPVSFRL